MNPWYDSDVPGYRVEYLHRWGVLYTKFERLYPPTSIPGEFVQKLNHLDRWAEHLYYKYSEGADYWRKNDPYYEKKFAEYARYHDPGYYERREHEADGFDDWYATIPESDREEYGSDNEPLTEEELSSDEEYSVSSADTDYGDGE